MRRMALSSASGAITFSTGSTHQKRKTGFPMRYRIDQTLVIEAGLLADGTDVHELANLLASYEGAAQNGFNDLAAIAETNLRKWVNKRRKRKWSCGSECPANCDQADCQFKVGC
jgi:hypothetical protein